MNDKNPAPPRFAQWLLSKLFSDKLIAVALPIPDVAPVIKAILFMVYHLCFEQN